MHHCRVKDVHIITSPNEAASHRIFLAVDVDIHHQYVSRVPLVLPPPAGGGVTDWPQRLPSSSRMWWGTRDKLLNIDFSKVFVDTLLRIRRSNAHGEVRDPLGKLLNNCRLSNSALPPLLYLYHAYYSRYKTVSMSFLNSFLRPLSLFFQGDARHRPR